jgi:hypothetical protein
MAQKSKEGISSLSFSAFTQISPKRLSLGMVGADEGDIAGMMSVIVRGKMRAYAHLSEVRLGP